MIMMIMIKKENGDERTPSLQLTERKEKNIRK